MKRIKFQGKEWVLVGEKDGAITTPELFESFEESYAHLCPDGRILRHRKEIGTIKDIEFLDDSYHPNYEKCLSSWVKPRDLFFNAPSPKPEE